MKIFSKNRFFKYLKGKTFERKGLGMELALLVLFVVFACSILLVSSALLGKESLTSYEQELRQRLTADELAERVLARSDPDRELDLEALRTQDKRFEEYTFEYIAGDESVPDTLTILLSEEPILTVRLSEKKIIEWSYH